MQFKLKFVTQAIHIWIWSRVVEETYLIKLRLTRKAWKMIHHCNQKPTLFQGSVEHLTYRRLSVATPDLRKSNGPLLKCRPPWVTSSLGPPCVPSADPGRCLVPRVKWWRSPGGTSGWCQPRACSWFGGRCPRRWAARRGCVPSTNASKHSRCQGSCWV